MNKDQPKKPSGKDSDEEIERQLKLIHSLASRLPWIAVVIILISMLFILLEAFFRRAGST
ncbi:MAG: hypothetical protein ACE5GN_02775 [Waddliaceae bacterium]